VADTKDLLAQASAALDAERVASQTTIDALKATNDSLSAANVQIQAQLDTANATIASLKAASDPWAAVDKTGATDVTDKVQALWNKGLPMPAGTYLLDAVKGLTVSTAVKLDPQAVLKVKPNDAARYCLVTVLAGGSIDGGQILGDRDTHAYSTTGTDEWGYGLHLKGDGAKASNVQISRCTGDGWIVSGDNVEARNIVSTGNRRQGCSVFACTGFRAYDCVSSDTAGAPNGPCAGWDFEPDSGSITDARLERCIAKNNRAGFLGWVRSNVTGNVDVTLVDCITDNNANGMQAHGYNGKVSIKVQGGTHTNRSSGCRVEAGSTFAVDGCTFAFTGKDRTDFTVTGQDSRTKYDIYVLTGGKAVVGTNTYK
jgi:hypothetical protein